MNDNTTALFAEIDLDELDQMGRASKRTPEADPRLRRPDRSQTLLQPLCLDELLPPDHDARVICAVVGKLDLSAFYKPLQARGSDPGRAATDPVLLVTLWLYATMKGVGRGRELARLCESHDAYRWICGGVRVNYHSLNDFRVGFEKELDELFTQVLAVLRHHGVVTVARISQDGTRVRASAGSSSFRRQESLEKRVAEMQAHVAALKTQLEAPDAEVSARKRAAQQRAAQDRLSRAEAALEELPKIAQAKAKQKNKPSKHCQARASTTDAEARFMKMPGGGSRPAYNVQLAADTESRAIVGVEVTNAGSDVNESVPMRAQVEGRTGQKVKEHLIDGGYIGLESVARAAAEDVAVYAPVPEPRTGRDRYKPLRGDPPGVGAWRERMGRQQAGRIYRQRASTIETINGDLKNYRGLVQLGVRGLSKVRCIAMWSALAYNVMHFAEVLMR